MGWVVICFAMIRSFIKFVKKKRLEKKEEKKVIPSKLKKSVRVKLFKKKKTKVTRFKLKKKKGPN